MNNLVFLPCTFAEIYNNTPYYLRGLDVGQFNALYLASIEYGGKPACIAVIQEPKIKSLCMVLTDDDGTIL